jgi:hypothetical protein
MLSEVYDLECLSNLFTYTGYCRQTKTYHQFVIHKLRNDYEALMTHLFRDKLIQIGYNNDEYDYPLLHHLINHYNEYKYLDAQSLTEKIYNKSQELIETNFTVVADWNKKILQIDLFKIWHYDNLAKSTSLKALEIAMNLPFVEDMPIYHTHWVTTYEEIEIVLRYNKKDVIATNEFLNITLGDTDNPLYKGKNKIELRQRVQKQYGLSCLNYNDIKLGTELILKLYCNKFKKDPKVVRKLRTFRDEIKLKDCIPTWCNFNTSEFKKLVEKFNSTTIYNGELKGALSYSVIYNNTKLDYGVGGCHACIKPGVYEADNDFMILDIDADGLYPCLAIQSGAYPEHLGIGFLDIYDGEIVSVRLNEKKKPKKERDFVIVEGFKLAANGFYGKSNSNDSYAYDPLYTLKTTISGQIMISMWIEKLVKAIKNLTILQVNTDGVSIMFNRKDYQKAIDVTSEMTQITGLTYEFNEYDKMVIRDVNNYSSKYSIDGKIKYKGAFEIDKELHKDPSMRIVSIALSEYFFKGIPVQQTIKNHKNIYDFCLRLKVDGRFIPEWHYINDEIKLDIKKLSKNTRYFISNHGGALYKRSSSDSTRLLGVSVGVITTIFNNYYESEDYDINYDFYIKECNKIINQIETTQLSLF